MIIMALYSLNLDQNGRDTKKHAVEIPGMVKAYYEAHKYEILAENQARYRTNKDGYQDRRRALDKAYYQQN